MDLLSNTVALSRMQFALTAIFHMLWPVLTTGMAIYLVIVAAILILTKRYASSGNAGIVMTSERAKRVRTVERTGFV